MSLYARRYCICRAQTHLLDLEVDSDHIRREAVEGSVAGGGHAEVVWLPIAIGQACIAGIVIIATLPRGALGVGGASGAVHCSPARRGVGQPLCFNGAAEFDLGRAALESCGVETDIR